MYFLRYLNSSFNFGHLNKYTRYTQRQKMKILEQTICLPGTSPMIILLLKIWLAFFVQQIIKAFYNSKVSLNCLDSSQIVSWLNMKIKNTWSLALNTFLPHSRRYGLWKLYKCECIFSTVWTQLYFGISYLFLHTSYLIKSVAYKRKFLFSHVFNESVIQKQYSWEAVSSGTPWAC